MVVVVAVPSSSVLRSALLHGSPRCIVSMLEKGRTSGLCTANRSRLITARHEEDGFINGDLRWSRGGCLRV